jgi:sporulation protein YlmC with PRC-barrel domain
MGGTNPGVEAVRLSVLLGSEVRLESGEDLGRVNDVRAELAGDGSVRVTGLVVAKLGVLERLGIGSPTSADRIRGQDPIPWDRVLRADARGVVVREP